MGCSFYSKNSIIIANGITFPTQNISVNNEILPNNGNKEAEISDGKVVKKEKNNEYFIITIQKFIKGYIFRKKYNDYLKTKLMDITNELYFEFIISTRNYKSSKILSKKENSKYQKILKTDYKTFYHTDPTLSIKKKIKNKKIYKNSLIFKYKDPKFISEDISECLQKVISCYKGSVELYSNIKCGYGELIDKEGNQLLGTFYEDKFCGWNISIKNNGTIYIGLFSNNELNGLGLQCNPYDDYYYRGHFVNSIKKGYGEETFNGNRFIGEFDKDLKNGQGQMIYKNNDIYKGTFVDDKICGQGVYIWYNKGKKYEGNFSDGKMNKNGILKWGNKYYKGEFNKGVKEGKGEFGFINNKQFFFDFKNGFPCGEGYYFDEKNNKQIAKYIFGKILKQNSDEEIEFNFES